MGRAQVCMVLQQVAEEVTQFNEDLGQEQRRALLSALIGALDPILPFLCSTIQTSLAAAMEAAQRQDFQLAAAHGSVAQAACGMWPVHLWQCLSFYALRRGVILDLKPACNRAKQNVGHFAIGHIGNDLHRACVW